MVFADILCSLRQRLLNAWRTGDKETLQLLMITFGILREASYESGDEKLSEVLTTFEDVTRDAIGGFQFPYGKGVMVPSKELIHSILKPNV